MSEGVGIYAGLKVLELGSGAASPVATRYFAEQGATVVRVESAVRPDFLRLLHMTAERSGGIDGAPMFVLLNPDKRSVSLNMSKPRAREIAERLVQWADVVSENFSPGVMEKWGLEAASLRRDHPGLIVVSGCLFGQTGPQRHYPGFGGQGAAIAGFNHTTGWPDREAVGPYGTITDSLSPRYVAIAVAAALLRRKRTGQGCTIDLSQIECGVYSLSEMIVRESAGAGSVSRHGNQDEAAAPHGIYPCAGDDRWIAIAVRSEAQWRALDREMGEKGTGTDPRFAELGGRLGQQEALDAMLAAWTREQEGKDLARRLQSVGVDAGMVQRFGDLLADPQLAYRGHFVNIAHPHLGPALFERSGLRLSEAPGGYTRPGPLLGQDNEALLGDVLGMSHTEIQQLVDSEVVA